jgi:hypothetical protein
MTPYYAIWFAHPCGYVRAVTKDAVSVDEQQQSSSLSALGGLGGSLNHFIALAVAEKVSRVQHQEADAESTRSAMVYEAKGGLLHSHSGIHGFGTPAL